MMKEMLLNALRAQGLKTLRLDTIVLTDLIGMVSAWVSQRSDVYHRTVVNLGN
jgi:hypothetical protein